ncbi:MAG: hypothetical protein SGPRY_002768 [Prymnesium sp.]
MFSARKKGGKKEQPQWKRDLEGHSDEEPPTKRALSAAPQHSCSNQNSDTNSAPLNQHSNNNAAPSNQHDDDDAALQESRTSATVPAPVSEESKHDDAVDDDDDDNFDPSNYDLGMGEVHRAESSEVPCCGSSVVPAEAIPPGALPQQTSEFSGGPMKGARYVDVDGRDTICFHSRGASNEACQLLVGSLPGYRATRFVREMVFSLFSDHAYAVAAMETLNKAFLVDEHGKKTQIRTEWAKRSLRPY